VVQVDSREGDAVSAQHRQQASYVLVGVRYPERVFRGVERGEPHVRSQQRQDGDGQVVSRGVQRLRRDALEIFRGVPR
jgi:hypothetical protein